MIPHLYQVDPVWANEPYAGGTIGENGCGPTRLAMVYVALTGRTNRGHRGTGLDCSEDAGFTVDGMNIVGAHARSALPSRAWQRRGDAR